MEQRAREMRYTNPRAALLHVLQIMARGTVRAALLVSSATCAATSYPLRVHVAARKVMQNAQPPGQPV